MIPRVIPRNRTGDFSPKEGADKWSKDRKVARTDSADSEGAGIIVLATVTDAGAAICGRRGLDTI